MASSLQMLTITFLFGFYLLQYSECCSQGSGCCRREIPKVQCNQGCQPGYSCGAYGCARRRALAGLTRRIDGVLVGDESGEQAFTYGRNSTLAVDISTMNVTKDRLLNPNFIFHSCCESRGLPDACLRHCHFNAYTAQTLERMFRHQDKCPIESANEIHYCAAQGLDHTQCCAASGVGRTPAGKKCLSFCDQTPNRFTTVDMSHLPCSHVLENMKRCFFTEIRNRAEMKFSEFQQDDSPQLLMAEQDL